MNQRTIYNVAELNSKIGSRKNLYTILKQKFVLPAYTSHACTLSYLLKYTTDPVEVYTCEIQGTDMYKPRYREKNAVELYEELEKLLEKKGKKPTGMTHLDLPDINWLCIILHKEDPNDSLCLFKKTTEIEAKKVLNEQ